MNPFRNLIQPTNTQSGIADNVLIAQVDWFSSIKTVGPYVNPGDSVKIKGTHEFKDGYGWLKASLAPEKNSYDAKSIGDIGFVQLAHELKVVMPGSYAVLHEYTKSITNVPIIVLIKDLKCAANLWYQIGDACAGAYASREFSTGSTKEGMKAYMLTITKQSISVLLYEGGITMMPEPEHVVARLSGELADTTVTLDGSASTGEAPLTYTYTVYFNDDANVPRTYVLPDHTDTATFETTDLVHWNEAGFAVVLTVSNGYETDSTQSSDPIDQKPLIFGGFDEGFDTGFDFNI